MEQWLGSVVGVALGVIATLTTTFVQNKASLRRQKLEMESNEKRHRRELRARFMDYLMKPRVEGHVAVLTQTWVLRSASAKYAATRTEEAKVGFLRAKNDFDVAYTLSSAWLREAALKEVSALSRDVEQMIVDQCPVTDIVERFAQPLVVTQWSMGIEDLEQYLRELGERTPPA